MSCENMRIRLTLSLIFFAMFVGGANAQENTPQEFVSRGWQEGTDVISDRKITVFLTPGADEYETRIAGDSGKQYQLKVVHNPLSSIKRDHWKVEFRELSLREGGMKEVAGDDLLESPPGPGKHYFPREDLLAYLYPTDESDIKVIIGGQRLYESRPFYPIKAVRKIRVECFYVVIKVKDYRLNQTDTTKVEFLDLEIKFQKAIT